MRMTAKQIIDDTVRFYSEDTSRRAVDPDSDGCFYEDERGCKCAVGRKLLDTELVKGNPGMKLLRLLIVYKASSLDELLAEEVRGHSRRLWLALQSLHDDDESWSKNGLSRKGKKAYEAMLKNHA